MRINFDPQILLSAWCQSRERFMSQIQIGMKWRIVIFVLVVGVLAKFGIGFFSVIMEDSVEYWKASSVVDSSRGFLGSAGIRARALRRSMHRVRRSWRVPA